MQQIHRQIYTFTPCVSYLTKCYLEKKSPSKTLALATSLSLLSRGCFNTKFWYYEQMKPGTSTSTSAIFALYEQKEILNADYESEVEDDILSIFRK